MTTTAIERANGANTEIYLTRYFYDLSINTGNLSIGLVNGLAAHWNLYKTQEYLGNEVISNPNFIGSPTWRDVRGTTYDAADRPLQSFDAGINPTQAVTTNVYDGCGFIGRLMNVLRPTGEQIQYAYDAMHRVTQVGYSAAYCGSGRVRTTTYDPDGRPASITSVSPALGTKTYGYDAAGRLASVTEPGNIPGAGTISYAYYGDGSRAGVSVSSPALYQPNLLQYAYRGDGKLSHLRANSGLGSGDFNFAWTPAGRLLTQSDPLTGIVGPGPKTITYDANGRIATYTLPGGETAQGFSYDGEGGVLGYTVPNHLGTGGSLTRTYLINSRNEVFGQFYAGDGFGDLHFYNGIPYETGSPSSLSLSANGFSSISKSYGPRWAGGQAPATTFDAYAGRLISTTQTQAGEGRNTTVTTSTGVVYDASGRMYQKTSTSVSKYGSQITNSCGDTDTRQYDAENHLTPHSPDDFAVWLSTSTRFAL